MKCIKCNNEMSLDFEYNEATKKHMNNDDPRKTFKQYYCGAPKPVAGIASNLWFECEVYCDDQDGLCTYWEYKGSVKTTIQQNTTELHKSEPISKPAKLQGKRGKKTSTKNVKSKDV